MKIQFYTKDVIDFTTILNGRSILKEKLNYIGISYIDNSCPISTDVNFTGQTMQDSTSVWINPNELVREVNKLGLKADIHCFLYDWTKIIPQPTNPTHYNIKTSDGGTIIAMPMQWYVNYSEVFAQFMLHELCHSYSYLTGKIDETHNQYLNNDYSQKHPIEYYLHLLKGLVPVTLSVPNKLPIVTIKRNGYFIQTPGELSIDGIPFCKTLELPWKGNQRNISCIPTGSYFAKWNFWSSKLKSTYLLSNVPIRSGIRIHGGNYAGSNNPLSGHSDIQGCILLGSAFSDINKDGIVDIINSTATVKAFNSKMAGKDFILVIK